jgi:hypothetical protein
MAGHCFISYSILEMQDFATTWQINVIGNICLESLRVTNAKSKQGMIMRIMPRQENEVHWRNPAVRKVDQIF